MSMQITNVRGFQIVQNMTTYAVWVYRNDVCLATAFLNGPLDKKTMLDLIMNILGRKK